MRSFNRHDRSGPRRDFGRNNFGRRSFGSGRREMHQAVCSNCGKSCEVPFEPTGSKPVYCRECFEKSGGGADSRRFSDRGSRKPELETINQKLDQIIDLLTIKPKKSLQASKKKAFVVEE